MDSMPPQLPPLGQGPVSPRKSSGFRFSDINWRGIAILVLFVVLDLLLWTVIREISGLGGSFGAAVMGWFREASINPENREGFTSFLYLVLVAGAIFLFLKMTGPK